MDNRRWIDLPKQARAVMEEALKKDLANFRRPKIDMFASPEAESVRNSIDSVEDEVFLSDANEEKASCIGLDIELTESPRFERENKTAWENENGDGKQTSTASRRWKKAAISARLCVDFAKKKAVGAKMDNTVSHEGDTTTNARNRRRRLRRASGFCLPMNATSLNDINNRTNELKANNNIGSAQKASYSLKIPDIDVEKCGATETLITSPSRSRFGRRLSPQLSRSLPEKFRPSPPSAKKLLSKSLSDPLSSNRSRNTLQPPRRTSSPALSMSSSRSSSPASSVCSSPGLTRRKFSLAVDSSSPASSVCSSPGVSRRRLSIASDSSACSSPRLSRRKLSLKVDFHNSSNKLYTNGSRPSSPTSSVCSSPSSQRKLSLASDLGTNRNIVSDLVHQRSEAISHLSDDSGASFGGKTECATSEKSFLLPQRCRITHPRQAWDTYKGDEIQSSGEISYRRHSETGGKTAAANQHRHGNIELTEYVDFRDNSRSLSMNNNVNVTFPGLSISNSDTISECTRSAMSSSTEDISSVKSKSVKNSAKLCNKNTNNDTSIVACTRTEADIVKDVEAEIQDRVFKRKQQLVQQAGGPEYHTRLQQRAQARSTGGQLRKVITELNEKRTTSELRQMASQKSHLQASSRFASPVVHVH